MLTNQQIECIENLVVGTMTNKEIAKKIGCTERVIYKWKLNEEFKAEWKKRSLAFETGIIQEAHNLLTSKLGVAINNIIDIANDKKESAKTRLDANEYLINRILGNTTTKVEQTIETDNKEEVINIDDMLKDVIEEDSNIIELDKIAKQCL